LTACARVIYLNRQCSNRNRAHSATMLIKVSPSKAAAYGFFIAQDQPFLDGNKRTAAASMLAFLYLNGFALDQTDDEMYEAFIRIATKEMSKDDFFAWVERHTIEDVQNEDSPV